MIPASPSDSSPSLRIVTVNWNAGNLLRECVDSLAGALTGGFRLESMTIVDNASQDGSAVGLETFATGLPLTVVANTENRGFAAACNQGAAGSKADWLLFLNPDTRLSANSLTPVFSFLADPSSNRIGALDVQLLDETGRTQRCCARRPSPGRLVAQAIGLDSVMPNLFPPHFMIEWDHKDTRDVDQAMGAFLMIRRSLFQDLGGFDERFFVYFDDVDLCLRIRQANWRVVHFAGATAYHKGGGTTDQVRATRLFYGWRSRLLFTAKHHGALALLAVTLATLFMEPLARLAQAVLRRRPQDAMGVLGGVARLWTDMPHLLPRLMRGHG